jgi:TolB-like protein
VRYTFDSFRLDAERFCLERAGEAVHVEPLVFDLLSLFVRNPGAVIDRDRMIAEVWGGRIVSDATLASAVKSARKALGDSGAAQTYIRTIRGRGFRFDAEIAVEAPLQQPPAAPSATPEPEAPPEPRLPEGGAPSIAVLPFVRFGAGEPFEGMEDAIPHEIIVALSRISWLSVIARGSSFRFRAAEADAREVGRRLGVRYCLTGALEIFGGRLAVGVELADTGSGAVIWGERLEGALDDVHRLRAEIVAGVTGNLEAQIQRNEALIAEGKPPENLDAWQAFHLGLKQVHLYTEAGTAAAEALFRRSVALEQGFARAHAGLSYTHFQNAFLRYRPDREAEIAASRRAAERGLEIDPLDPFCNFNMGRSFWITKDLDSALPWLERAVQVSPSFAQGIYSRSLIDTLAGRGGTGSETVELAMQLSPLDPLLHAMRGTKALALVTAGQEEAAAKWGSAAARTPRAHEIIDLIATAANALGGDAAMARHWAGSARRRKPEVSRTDFFDALPVQDPATRARIDAALAGLGF